MKSGWLLFLLYLLLPSSISSHPGPPSPSTKGDDDIKPRAYNHSGAQIIEKWHELQSRTWGPPYDVDSCYGWIGLKPPRKGQYLGLGFTPNCKIISEDLTTFYESYQQLNREHERYSESAFHQHNQCAHHHLMILRLHRIDEGGIFSYHYARVIFRGNKVEVTMFARKDVLNDNRDSFHTSSANYEHPSIKFQSADEFNPSFKPFVLYSIDFEIHVWFKSKEGLRLYNYRVNWDTREDDNGFHVDLFSLNSIPNAIIPQDRVAYLMTSDDQVHYFFVRTANDNEHNVYILKHNDLLMSDFSRLEFLEMNMPVDVYPRNIVGGNGVMAYYSLAVVREALRYNTMCTFGAHITIYSNQTRPNDLGELQNDIPEITDPPLALNIFATHFRSSYPFVKNGRRTRQPNYHRMTVAVVISVCIILLSSWIIVGYGMFPTSIARRIRVRLSGKRGFMFKARSKRKHGRFTPLFKILYRMELLIWCTWKRIYNVARWIWQMDTNNDEETRPLVPTQQDNISTRDATTPNE